MKNRILNPLIISYNFLLYNFILLRIGTSKRELFKNEIKPGPSDYNTFLKVKTNKSLIFIV